MDRTMSMQTASLVLKIPGEVTPVGWIPPSELSLEDWGEVGQTLGHVNRLSRWLLGDWLNYGERRYGETYSQFADSTGLSVEYLTNLASIARRVGISCRREDLSFGHHEAVAKLTPIEQRAWLARAAEQHWTRHELRERLAPLFPAPVLHVVSAPQSAPETPPRAGTPLIELDLSDYDDDGELPLDGQPETHEHRYVRVSICVLCGQTEH